MENKYFSHNGRLLIPPFKTNHYENGKDFFDISFYKIDDKYTFSIKSQLQNRIFVHLPHSNEKLYTDIASCKQDGFMLVKKFCDENRLKKCFHRIVPNIFWQIELFDEL